MRTSRVGRRAPLTLAAFLVGLLAAPLGAQDGASELPTLTSIAAVRSLDRTESNRGYPVRVQATVSHCSTRGYTALFVDDGTAGIWVDANDEINAHPPRFGDLVEVEATTHQAGLFAPILTNVTLTVIGERPLPEPARPPYYELATSRYDSLWIELEGTVQTVSQIGGRPPVASRPPVEGRLVGQIAVPGGMVEINFGDLLAESLPPLVDAHVRLRGVCGSDFTTTGQLVGLRIFIGRLEDVVVETPAPEDPFALEPKPLGRVLEFSPGQSTGHRIHARGVVTAARTGRFLYLADETGGLKVESTEETAVSPGDIVDAVGFPTFVPGSRPSLSNATFRRSGRGQLPKPQSLAVEELLTWEHDATLVRIHGQFLGVSVTPTSRVLTLRVREHVFNAEVETTESSEALAGIVEGSDIRVTGVHEHVPGPPVSLRLYLPTPGDVVVTRAASWWRLRHTLVLAASLLGVLAVGGLWIHSATRKNRVLQETHGKLTRAHTELEARNTELERFTYVVSHDLKSPLVTIRGFLGYVEQHARTGELERLEADAGRIRAATERMNHLLDDLLELSRTGRIERPHEDLLVGELVNEARAVVSGRIAAGGVRVEVDPAAASRTVRGDRGRLVELMQNLLDNAAKFTGEQTDPAIWIGVREGSGEGGPVFTVCDNGLGLDPAHHARVFDIFEKLDPSSEGTGLGLALVHRIVETHGGRIWVESKGRGHGSTFCFTLPPEAPG